MSDRALQEARRAAVSDPEAWRDLASAYRRDGNEPGFNLANAKALYHERGEIGLLDIGVNWMDDWANSPKTRVLASRIPQQDEFIYTNVGSVYFAQVGPICRFFVYSSPGRGYGGAKFNLLMDTGETEELIGPWSGNSKNSNDLGFPNCTECSLTDSPEVMSRGHTAGASAVTVSAILPLLKLKNLGLCLMKSGFYVPTSRKKYPENGPYFTKAVRSSSPFETVEQEILAPRD